MDIAQLTRFVAVAEKGSFRLAAEALGISQPSISWSIQQLEGLLGAVLIERGARGAKLTDLGEILLPRAKLVISETERALADFHEIKRGRDATLTVGVSPVFINDIFPQASAALLAKHPDIILSVTEGYSIDLMAAAQSGAIDMAFCGFPPDADASGLAFEETCDQRYILAARKAHPLCDGREITDRLVLDYPWVMYATVNFAVLPALQAVGLPTPVISARTRSMHYIRSMILHADLVGYLPREFVQPDIASGAVCELPTSIMTFAGPAGIIDRADGAQTRVMRALKAEIRAACRAAGYAAGPGRARSGAV